MSHIRYFDAHAHLDDAYLASSFEGGTDGAARASHEQGVCGIVNAGTNIENSLRSIELASTYPFVYAAVGIYPADAQELGDGIDAALCELEELLEQPKVVAVGEIGLDYHYDGTDKARQLYAFERQLELSVKHDLPVVIHDREAHGDIMDALQRHRDARGMIHSFSGSAEMARQLSDMGWYISFGGVLTYKNAQKVKQAACVVPTERIITETDSPYLTPVPHRGKVNFPANVAYTLQTLASLRGVGEQELATAVCENAERLFSISLK